MPRRAPRHEGKAECRHYRARSHPVDGGIARSKISGSWRCRWGMRLAAVRGQDKPGYDLSAPGLYA